MQTPFWNMKLFLKHHFTPNTFSHSPINPFSSTLSGMPATSTCSHWN